MTDNLQILIFPILLPFLVCCAFTVPQWRYHLVRISPWTAIPALILAVSKSFVSNQEVSWILLGMTFGMDATAKVFLFFTSIVWFISGLYAISYLSSDSAKNTFFVYYLLSMCGNFGLILTQDIVSFYFYFGLMSFAAYGLVIHERTAAANFAGTVYICLVIIGEVLIFSGMVLTTQGVVNLHFQEFSAILANHERAGICIGLLLFGFGVKAGTVPLHVWLPLAHPVAPTPASAVLSGVMIKAGILGWIRFLPVGELAIPFWGIALVVLGLVGAYYSVIIGLVQSSAKTVLAYSSVSQMGLMSVAVGVGMAEPAIWPYLWTVLMIFAAHHAFAKGALFLSVGTSVEKRNILWLSAFLFPAIALVGAPFTSGFLVKSIYKLALEKGLPVHPGLKIVMILIVLSAIGTFLLLARFCWISLKNHTALPERRKAGIFVPWALLVFTSLALPLLINILGLSLPPGVPSLGGDLTGLWPFFIGGSIAAAALIRGWCIPFKVSEGDIVNVYIKAVTVSSSVFYALWKRGEEFKSWASHHFSGIGKIKWSPLEQFETYLGIWRVFGMAFLTLMGMIFLFLAIHNSAFH